MSARVAVTDWRTELEALSDLVRQAGTLAVAARRTLVREMKPDQSLVTNVDRAVEEFLRRGIGDLFPGDGFYGEEGGGDPLGVERMWITDPIDGTTNFVFGLPVWGVSLGLSIAGIPTMGAFYLPVVGEFFSYSRGRGAWCNGRALRVDDLGPVRHEDAVTISGEVLPLLDLSRLVGRHRNFGSLTAHWCWTASGATRLNVSVRDRLHDIGAAFGLALESGCVAEYLEGGEVRFDTFLREPLNLKPILLGSPSAVHHARVSLSV